VRPIVGDVMGKFHPHGDQSIYDALVRLAQDFAVRYPLVDGQGNFGNIDGDNAAAMRYTEARMTEVARLLLDGIDEDAVDFRRTYDGEDEEPVVLPAPSQPARQRLVRHRRRHGDLDPAAQRGRALRRGAASDRQSERDDRELLQFVPGPDFPTGGIIVEPRGVDRRGLPHRPRLVPRARALDKRGQGARHLSSSSSPRFPIRCRSRG
jgi:topoisomerase IV subunit A